MTQILGQDYIDTFLQSHHPFDYAREFIIYPRTGNLYREYCESEIKEMRTKTPWCKKPLPLRKCRPSLLEYHLRQSSKFMKDGFPEWKVETYISGREEIEKIYASRWILVSYHDDSIINFIQIDIDRHGLGDDEKARTQVRKLEKAAREYRFEVVWTTSPGYQNDDRSIVHGLYAWIRLNQNHFVMDIRPHLVPFLISIGLGDIAHNGEGAFLRRKKLLRLPGQFNVELADPTTFSKIYDHSPIDANKVFQKAWLDATPLSSKLLTSFTPQSPRKSVDEVYTQCSVTPSPLSPQTDTFTTLLQWGRPIVNQFFPDRTKIPDCVAQLIKKAQKELPDSSATRNNYQILQIKAKGIVKYLFENTASEYKTNRPSASEDARLFKRHAAYINKNWNNLLNALPPRLYDTGEKILNLLLRYNGRLAAVQIYHGTPVPICTYRNWRLIQSRWQLTTLVEYQKITQNHKGTCKLWGFRFVQ